MVLLGDVNAGLQFTGAVKRKIDAQEIVRLLGSGCNDVSPPLLNCSARTSMLQALATAWVTTTPHTSGEYKSLFSIPPMRDVGRLQEAAKERAGLL